MTHIKTNLSDMLEKFNNDDKCRTYLEYLRWPNGPVCPKCNKANGANRVGGRTEVLRCQECYYQFSVTAGTIFNDSHLPLTKWFLATHLICEAKKGISALQIMRLLGIGGYKTAWYLCHRIRQAMLAGNEAAGKLSGTVEVDETWIGGINHGKGHAGYKDNKTAVVGLTERNGRLRMVVVPDVTRKTLEKTINQHVSENVELIISDEFIPYTYALRKGAFAGKHHTINHSKSFAEGKINTNSIENRFSLLKRGVVGSWHKVSVKHLQRYLEEVSFRFSQRDNPYLFSETLLNLLTTDPLTFDTLTGKKAT